MGYPEETTAVYKARLLQRFWAKVDQSPGLGPKGDCWEWIGAHDLADNSYGNIGVTNKHAAALGLTYRAGMAKAHVVAWVVAYGHSVPPGCEVCHFCNYKRCVKESHIYTATHLANIRHAIATGMIKPSQKPVLYRPTYATPLTKKQGMLLREARIRSGQKWRSICHMFEIENSQLSRMENGIRGIRIDKLICLLRFLNVDTDEFDLASIPLVEKFTRRENPKPIRSAIALEVES